MRTLVAALLLALPSVAGTLPKLPPTTMALIDAARGLPPEFCADILLRLAASSLIAEPDWKRQLIEEAFVSAGHAQLPYQKHGEWTTDARTSRLFWRNGLDALTLETRAVEAMFALDLQRAVAMFLDIPTPQVAALTCQETGTPDLSIYYETAAKVFVRGFTEKQRHNAEDVAFLETLIGQMQSPAHVPPVVKLIYTSRVTEEQRKEMVAMFAGVLGRINGSPRIFGAASTRIMPMSAPVKLPEGIRPSPPMLPAAPGQVPAEVLDGAPALIPALRAYIVRHVHGPRCSDDSPRTGTVPVPVADFNVLVAALDRTATLYKPISEEEATPDKIDGTFQTHMWWQSKRSRQVLAALQWLNHGNRDGPDRFFTPEERKSSDWNAHFLDTLKLIEGWKEEEESSPEDWFGMVSESYSLMADKAPPGEQRQGAMARYMNFMETHYASIESRNLWFTQWKNLWRSTDPWIVEQLSASANQVIALYAKVGKLGAPSASR